MAHCGGRNREVFIWAGFIVISTMVVQGLVTLFFIILVYFLLVLTYLFVHIFHFLMMMGLGQTDELK
jgi:hypothetical protein